MKSRYPLERPASGKAVTVVASTDISLRRRIRSVLEGLRWSVLEAGGGAEAFGFLEEQPCEALLLDGWLPDLEIQDFIREFYLRHPETDLLMIDSDGSATTAKKSPRRQELLYAMRCGRDAEQAIEITTKTFVETVSHDSGRVLREHIPHVEDKLIHASAADRIITTSAAEDLFAGGFNGNRSAQAFSGAPGAAPAKLAQVERNASASLPEFVGESAQMLELCRLIRLVAPRKTTVLIEGPTGSGKELVARATHRLSTRSHQPYVVLNCAAIPEALLEAELFGHTRGAFTGAVQARMGRLEAAHGGTLFLDEIAEMPLALQAKLLRFLEQGELQRVGENEPVRVDVRVLAATHQSLALRAQQGSFRPDLFFRLAVFPLEVPGLNSRPEDIPPLALHFLNRSAAGGAVKKLSTGAIEKLLSHNWPGSVRELQHVIERAYILAEERGEIGAEEVRFICAWNQIGLAAEEK